jgi:hypothetical protein
MAGKLTSTAIKNAKPEGKPYKKADGGGMYLLVNQTLVERSALNMGEYPDAADMYMKMALKSQAQCRATIEALSSIKNPSVVKANQLNMAHNQQVNNASLADETKNTPTQLLEETDGQQLDTPKTQETVGVDSPMETLEPIHRADINGG